jgi:hypothetical protein
MDIDQTEIDRLVAGPAETRDVEIKAWIDPRTPEGKVKLLTALLALRNFNGGRLVIGFHNKTLQPLPAAPADILDAFHNDDIQGLISRHSPIHLENLLELARIGATIFPPMLAFYNRPASIEAVLDHLAVRILDQFGLEHSAARRWEGMKAAHALAHQELADHLPCGRRTAQLRHRLDDQEHAVHAWMDA